MNEQWRPIPGHDGYEASTMGRIRSIDRIVERIHPNGTLVRQPLKGRILSPSHNKNGYLYVALGGGYYILHRLIALTWVDGFRDGLDAAHENNNRHDNRPENLAWKTRKENLDDQLRHGTRLRGEKQNGAKLTEDQVIQMRLRRCDGISWRLIGAEFGVATMTAKNAVVGNTWKHVAGS